MFFTFILIGIRYKQCLSSNKINFYLYLWFVTLEQWFLTFLKSGNAFDYMKNLRNAEINDPKNKQKHPA